MPAHRFTSQQNLERLCQACGIRPACNLICQIINGLQIDLALCEVCALVHTFQSENQVGILEESKCYYCGGTATFSITNMDWEAAVRGQAIHCYCYRCGGLLDQFTMESMTSFPSRLPLREQYRYIERLTREVDERVRAEVRKAE